jgi:hypothetical protein
MPSYGEMQKPAGVNKTKPGKPCGKRRMMSKNMNIRTSLKIDNVPYKGNAVLNANK